MAQKEHTKAGQHASGRFFLDDINLSKLKLRGQGLALVSVDFFYFIFLKKDILKWSLSLYWRYLVQVISLMGIKHLQEWGESTDVHPPQVPFCTSALPPIQPQLLPHSLNADLETVLAASGSTFSAASIL